MAATLKSSRRLVSGKHFGTKTLFDLARRKYIVHVDVNQDRSSMRRYAAILDTGAGSSFIKNSASSLDYLKKILPVKSAVKVRDANNRQFSVVGKINLYVQIRTKASLVTFYVVGKLATSIILGCDFCDMHIEVIRPRRRCVELDDVTTAPIVCRTSARNQLAPPLPRDQVYIPPKGRASTKIQGRRQTIVQSGTQTFVDVTTDRNVFIEVEPIQHMPENHSSLAGYGVAQVSPEKTFKITVANFCDEPKTLLKGQAVANAKPHPTSVQKSGLSHA